MTKRFQKTVAALLLLSLFTGTVQAVVINKIIVRGKTVEITDASSVLAYVSIKEGEEFDRGAVSRDMRALEKSGRFSYVGMELEQALTGVDVIITVDPKQQLRRLKVDGGDYYDNKKIAGLLELQAGDRVDDAIMAVKAKAVKDSYAKRYYPNAEVTWSLEPVPGGRQVDVFVRVDEGLRSRVSDIQFEGNTTLSDRKLKKVMRQKESTPMSFLTRSGTFDIGLLEADRETIRSLYRNEGYLDVDVAEPELTRVGKKKIEVEIAIREGSLYRIGDIKLEGVTLYPEEEVVGLIGLKLGDIASLRSIGEAAQRVEEYYTSRGYFRTRVRHGLDADLESGIVDITFSVTEGELAYIRQIHIRGNTRTKDKVIRRELAVYPGDVMNQVKVRRSERRLQNLSYFSFVNSTPEPTYQDNEYDLAFEVEEQKTGQFVIGAGFSSIDDLIGFVEVSQGNFDIKAWPHFTGGGQKLKLRAQFGTERNDIELSFTEPWFLDRRLSLGIDLFQHDRKFLSDDYDQINRGGRLTLGKGIGGFNRLNLIYSLENIEVTDVDDTASDLIKAEEGDRVKSAMTLELVHDSRNNAFTATRGTRSVLAGTLAGGPLAGDTDIYLIQTRLSQYYTLWFDHVINFRGWAAGVESYGDSETVPIFDKLFLGGARTMRGFKFRDVGPKDENGEPIGGQTAYYGTAEYTIPLASRIRFATFYDIGAVNPDAFDFDTTNLNSDWGIGIRFDMPGFPLRLDYAWPIEADEFNDSGGRFNFLLGYVF